MVSNNVLVLLSSYNGEKYLREQLESIEGQQGVAVNILVRDDGSRDNTISIIQELSDKYGNITLIRGDNVGFAKSFWTLLKQANNNEYYAFCDQDDIWLPNKLSSAIAKIKKCKQNQPLLYTSNVTCVDSNGDALNEKLFDGRKIDFFESLIRSILPGCTFVFNEKAREIASQYDGRMYAHDWAIYTITSAFGEVIYDENNYIRYRLHSQNAIGAHNKIQDLVIKIKRLMKKSPNVRMHFAYDFYSTYGEELSGEIKEQVYLLGHYQDSFYNKRQLLKSKYFKDIIFKIYILLNRV